MEQGDSRESIKESLREKALRLIGESMTLLDESPFESKDLIAKKINEAASTQTGGTRTALTLVAEKLRSLRSDDPDNKAVIEDIKKRLDDIDADIDLDMDNMDGF